MTRVLVVMMVCAASLVWAFRPGDELWVRDDDTPLFKEPQQGDKPVLTLKAGEAVKWLGPSEKDKTFHLVKARGQSGYVRFTALTPNSPSGEKGAAFTAPIPQLSYGTAPPIAQGSDETRRRLAAVEELNRQVAEAKH